DSAVFVIQKIANAMTCSFPSVPANAFFGAVLFKEIGTQARSVVAIHRICHWYLRAFRRAHILTGYCEGSRDPRMNSRSKAFSGPARSPGCGGAQHGIKLA